MKSWSHRLVPFVVLSALPLLFISLSGCPPANRATVPNLVGMTQSQAGTALALVDLELGTVTNVYSNTVTAGLVISQNPLPGLRVLEGSDVDIVISLGPPPPGTVIVPTLAGLTQAQATTALAAADLDLGNVTTAHSNTVAEGLVISQNPAAGSAVDVGTDVDIVISLGPPPNGDVAVPDLAGLTQAAAAAALDAAGLNLGGVTTEYSNTVAADLIISQDPLAGVTVVPGTDVNIVVSLGPPPNSDVMVPDLVGISQAEAVTALGLVDLDLGTVNTAYSDTVAVGLIISQNPAAGTTVDVGTDVDIAVSLGPAPAEGEGEGEMLSIMLPGEVPLKFVQIEAGSFTMGSASSEAGRMFDESPQHLVTIAKSFWISQTEVTQQQWQALMGTTPWQGQPNVAAGLDSPAVYISWNDAQDFITALNALTGDAFRLPSEAEWEFAARAGARTRFYWGNDPVSAAVGNYAWWDGNAGAAGEAYAHTVAIKLPNDNYLYDMAGNVWEWCQDWYHNSYKDAPDDGSPWETPAAKLRIRRRGGWASPAELCRSAYRSVASPDAANDVTGFRIAR